MNGLPFLSGKTEEEIFLKTRPELEHLKVSGKLVATVLKEISRCVRPGVSTESIERICRQRIAHYRNNYTIEKYPDFPTFLSISVNDTAVHGIPNEVSLKNGDIITLDLVMKVNGWYGDHAVTLPVGSIAPKEARLIDAAREATLAGIAAAKAGNRFGDIGAAVREVIQKYELKVFDVFVGHGIGKELHEGPVVYMKGEEGVGQPIVPGMVFTIEPVLTRGMTEYKENDDGYSLNTKDGECTALFEHMVAIQSDQTIVLSSA